MISFGPAQERMAPKSAGQRCWMTETITMPSLVWHLKMPMIWQTAAGTGSSDLFGWVNTAQELAGTDQHKHL